MILAGIIVWVCLVILVLKFFQAANPDRNDSYNRTKDIER